MNDHLSDHNTGHKECCPAIGGPFSARRKFDVIDGKEVPRPCCKKNLEGNHFGPFGGPGWSYGEVIDATQPVDLNTDGYGWPPANYLPWGETEKVIDQALAEEGPWTIGEPFTANLSEYPQPGPLGLVYLAGPMRGIESFNFPAFHAAAKGLREQGWGVFNPAEMDESDGFDFTGTTGDEDLASLGFSLRNALGKDLDFITRRADAVAVLPGWEDSRGARAEVATARALGLPVFDAIEGPARPIVDPDIVGQAQIRVGGRWTDRVDIDVTDVIKAMNGSVRQFAEMYGGPASVTIDATEPGLIGYTEDWHGFEAIEEVEAAKRASVDGEVRTVSSTGGQKGKKPEVYDQIPPKALAELARHFGAGAEKYDAHNFRKGYPWSLCFNALMRHAWAFQNGEDYDVHKDGCPADCTDHLPGSKHIIAVAWHALVLATFMDEHPEFDDRYRS